MHLYKVRFDGVLENEKEDDIKKGLKWIILASEGRQYKNSKDVIWRPVNLRSKIEVDRSLIGKVVLLIVTVHPYKFPDQQYADVSFQVIGVEKT